MKLVILDGYTENPGDLSWQGIADYGDLTVYDRTPPEEIIARMAGAEAVFTNKTLITEKAMAATPSLRYIGLLSTGTNTVDLNAAKARGIPVTNIPAYSTDEVAQHTLALLLEICNQVGLHSGEVQAGRWAKSADFCYWDAPLLCLAGQTFGCIGFGAIGRRTAQLMRALGMEILATGSRETEEGRALASYVPLEELLAKADVVSLHCPLTPETKHLIDEKRIAQMKDGAILLNTARGPLIDEEALAAALASGKLYAAGLDVVSKEPMKPDNPLLGAKNCYITPHIAWAPFSARSRLMGIAEANLRGYAEGKLQNVVNGL